MPTKQNNEFLMGHLIPGRPALSLSDTKDEVKGVSGLDIEYRGRRDCPYGEAATSAKKPFAGLVIHHTSPDHTLDWYVQYQIDGDRKRGGHFGYHFFIGDEGKIIQGAPLTKRTNHINPEVRVRREFGKQIQNTNSIGITCVGAGRPEGFSPSPAQVDAVNKLAFALCDLYSISFLSVFGHGEIQTNRHKTEGAALAKAIREWQHVDQT